MGPATLKPCGTIILWRIIKKDSRSYELASCSTGQSAFEQVFHTYKHIHNQFKYNYSHTYNRIVFGRI
jgi:hypothetical protein